MSDRLIVLAAVVLCLSGCSSSDDTGAVSSAVPRPTAYPRLDLPDTASVVLTDGLPVHVRVSQAATCSVSSADGERPAALTVDYPPRTGASVYFTFIPVDGANIEKVLDARRERISLNLNGAPASTTHAFGDGIEAVIVTAQTGSQTPVQLLADIDGRWVVSATAFVHEPSAAFSYDSVRPLYDRLSEDMAKALGPLTVIKSR
ncbi:MAG: hypothetical protein K2K84_03370 [Muribaculaceae bacterium]|nr:hypothetical protein [Muribaculaceae bacterium]